MARVTVLPRSEAIGVVDARKLLADKEPPGVDPSTGAPDLLRSFVVHLDPRMTVVPNFLTECECQHLRELADGQYSRSLVGQLQRKEQGEAGEASEAGEGPSADDSGGDPGVGGTGLKSRQAQTRTSSSCMLRPAQTAVLERIEHRLASLAKQPLENLERLVVVRYSPGEQFSEHHDGKFRPRTVFVYLNDLPEDDEGDTFFPYIGLSFVPRTGCAVMWTNPTPEGVEDSRMLHAGRPPLKAVKYGVNCFFNEEKMRLVKQPKVRVEVDQAFFQDIRALRNEDAEKDASEALHTFTLATTPKVVAVPRFASEAEVDHLLRLSERGGSESVEDKRFFADGTVPVRTFEVAETDIVAALEVKLAAVAHFPAEHLGRMRVVRGGTEYGLCNRGIGQRAALVCLADQDEVHFPHLGLRLLLRRGDLILWPNAWWSEPVSEAPGARMRVVEDLRTTRVHLLGDGVSEPPLALDASFHDQPVSTRLQAPPAG